MKTTHTSLALAAAVPVTPELDGLGVPGSRHQAALRPIRSSERMARWALSKTQPVGRDSTRGPLRMGRTTTALQLAGLFGVGCGDDGSSLEDAGADARSAMDGAILDTFSAPDASVPPDPRTVGAGCEMLPDFGVAPDGVVVGQVVLDNDAAIMRPCEVAVGSFALAEKRGP